VVWQPKIAVFKEILNKLGLTNIRFSLRKKNGNNFLTLPPKLPIKKNPSQSLPRSNNHRFSLPPE
jgi:hypothetical protein